MIYKNITSFALISEKDQSVIETRRLKNVVTFSQTVFSFFQTVRKE